MPRCAGRGVATCRIRRARRSKTSMNETLTGFAALALLGFGLAFALLMLFMALVQPIWSVVDCAIDRKRGTLGKVLWIVALILLWGVANWFYGAFAASNRLLLRLTRLAWVLMIGLVVAFAVYFYLDADFRRGVEKEWHERVLVVQAPAPGAAAPPDRPGT
jgi:uncharacterized membrane protein YidH (DUF202 family)